MDYRAARARAPAVITGKRKTRTGRNRNSPARRGRRPLLEPLSFSKTRRMIVWISVFSFVRPSRARFLTVQLLPRFCVISISRWPHNRDDDRVPSPSGSRNNSHRRRRRRHHRRTRTILFFRETPHAKVSVVSPPALSVSVRRRYSSGPSPPPPLPSRPSDASRLNAVRYVPSDPAGRLSVLV